jgi:hypothetical protein
MVGEECVAQKYSLLSKMAQSFFVVLFTGHHTQIPRLGPTSMAAPIGYARLDFFLQVFKIGEKKGQINNIWAQRPLEIRNNYANITASG